MDVILYGIQNVVALCQIIFFDQIEPDDEDSEDEEFIELFLHRLANRVNGERNIPHRIELFVERTVEMSTDQEFQSHFRISRQAFIWIHETVSPLLKSGRCAGRQTIDTKQQLLAVLWLLATPDSYRSVGSRFNLGKSTLSAAFVRVIRALNKIAPSVISWPSEERRIVIEAAFARMASIHGVIGAVDGTYIPIKAPKENPEAYINRKCFHGITLRGICDNSLKFIDCFAGYPSSVSDIRIFRNSDIYTEFVDLPNNYFGPEQFIIGDKAHPVLKWCIPPYIERRNVTRCQRNFNTAHAKTRQVIERCFALLFGRFRRLRYSEMNRVDLIPATIIAGCVFHNICLNHPDDLIEIYVGEGTRFVQVNDEYENDVRNPGDLRHVIGEGVTLRDRIARLLH